MLQENPTIFYEIERLAETIKKEADGFKLITFDLFDTLLIRRIAEPDQIKEPVAKYIAKHASILGIKCSWQDVLKKRWEVENKHRQKNATIFPDAEAIYPQFMKEALQEILGENFSDDFFEKVANFEMQLESDVLVPREALIDVLTHLKKLNKTIWIMTDIYLPSNYIVRLLNKKCIMHMIDGVVSSADECKAKASGAGFISLKNKLQIDPAFWLHVGDNIYSDGKRPAEFGIRSFVLQDKKEFARKKIYSLYLTKAHKNHFWRGRMWQQLSAPLEAENTEKDALYIEGYNFFGPLAVAFVKYIAEKAKELQLKRIYFFSREGRIFLDIWQKAVPYFFQEGSEPKTSYLYVSRMALAPATCAQNGISHANAPLAFLPAKNRDLRDLCRVFGLKIEPLIPIFKKHNLDIDTPLNPIYKGWSEAGWHNFDELLKDDDFKEAVKLQTSEYGRLFEKYLEQEGFFEFGEVGVVDIGWLGTIQRFLYDAIAHRADCPKIYGFLFAATRGIPYPSSSKNTIQGFIYDKLNYDLKASFIENALNIFEEAYRAPDSCTISYATENGKVLPVKMADNFSSRKREILQDTYFASLRKGIYDFADRAIPALKILEYSSLDVLPWLKHILFLKMAFPSYEEVKLLKWQHHLDEYEGKTHKPPFYIRIRLTTLWDMPVWFLRWMPCSRMFFFVWKLFLMPIARYCFGKLAGLKRKVFK